MKKQSFKIIFIALFLVICLIPSLGMTVAKTETTSENRVLASFPALKSEEGEFNVNYLSQLGDYFNDHFAFRNLIVALIPLFSQRFSLFQALTVLLTAQTAGFTIKTH